MFLKSNRWYGRSCEQNSQGPFLMLFSLSHITHPEEHKKMEVRACVRSVHLRQLGHWMMGSVKVGPHKITVSGCYGEDGLTMDPDKFPGLWEQLVPLPEELRDLFWKGGGHNSAGSEGQAIHDWAVVNEKLLRIRWKNP